ncbi:aminotransferase class I/II-fold pyridoxal phosphate-dependent enzyme [Sphingomonas sp. H160509]|uniref:aminotransferase class I/II-fold pyridoxal phosphate-dependent enzyme n=1 Tax=Sphingomonas sp. H160509 TaxID=2955313 RepID=UPI002097D444|nr:aminotransferase class I/II-fold pyridoxal phosphate-dependent enzyme [Sphingomonas sp. H160509]MDD1450575.1 aminotransferase class I/II-fold pyridoxal phosphate-dependent enzyme [Sphingomonas sp. H160509]
MNALRIHGGRIDLAAVHYPDAPRPWLDLSTGINPYAWPTESVPTVDLHSLPSPAAIADLEASAAAVFGTTADRVVALPGTELGLRMLAALDLPSPVRFVVPSYATHAEAIDGAVPIARATSETVADGTLLLANPNNPDGHRDTPQRLLTIARSGAFLIVDEAFADVAPESSLIPLLRPDDRAIVFRSFGKFFGLPGVRLGFMIGPPEYVAEMRQRLGSWPISAHAVAYGIAAYRDAAWIATARVSIVERAARLNAMLARRGLYARGECALFRLIETDAAPALFERLAQVGILTRTFDHSPRWLRMGVPGSDQAFARLDEALGGG